MSDGIPLLIVIVLLVLGFIVAFAIGANDETVSTVVGARVLTINSALLLGAVLQLIGAQLLGPGCSKTIGADMVLTPFSLDIVLVLVSGMAIWLFVTSILGYPISSTHSLFGAILGVGLWFEVTTHTPLLNWSTLQWLLACWILGPFVGLGAAFGFQLLARRVLFKKPTGSDRVHRLERIFGWLLLAMVIVVGASRGGNDVSKAVGMLVMVFPNPIVWPLLLLLGSTGMGAGLFIVGRRVVTTVGTRVTALRPSTGFSAEASMAIVLFVATVLGIPFSGTEVLVAAVVGVGLANHDPVRGSTLKRLILVALLTIPLSAAFALGLLWLYSAIRAFLLL
jgi:PiT family inorganic phosphate transporter